MRYSWFLHQACHRSLRYHYCHRGSPGAGPEHHGGRFAALLDRLSIHGTGRRLVVGTGWSAAGKVAAHGLSVVTSVVLARLLGSAGLGEVAMVQSVTAAFGVVAGLGLGLTTRRAIAELRAEAGHQFDPVVVEALIEVVSGQRDRDQSDSSDSGLYRVLQPESDV